MKKIFTLFASMVLAIAANADVKTLYSWESPEGTAVENGGTIEYVNGENLADATKPSRLNYKNSVYYTICLNGKKANIDDIAPSANAGHMVVTFDHPLKAGDEIVMTAYYNKGEVKPVSAWLVFDNGTTASSVRLTQDIAVGDTPEEVTVVVPAEAEGSKTLKMTRNDSGTNMFITKLVVKGERTAKELLNDVIVKATAISETLEDAKKATLKEAIDVAQGVYDNATDDAEIESAIDVLEGAIEEAVPTAISAVSVNNASAKVAKAIVNGKVVIVKGAKQYNVAGQEL